MAKRYDWIKLKQEFLESDSQSVSSFIEQRIGKETARNHHLAEMTKGWSEEKEKLRKDIQCKALLELQDEKKEKYKKFLDKMVEAEMTTFNIAMKRLTNNPSKLSIKDIKILWEISRISQGKSTNKTENEINTDEPRREVVEAIYEDLIKR